MRLGTYSLPQAYGPEVSTVSRDTEIDLQSVMAAEAGAGPIGHSHDSSTISKSAMNPESSDLSTSPEMTDKEEDQHEYIHGPRFGLIFAA